jgi:hypothetical protein
MLTAMRRRNLCLATCLLLAGLFSLSASAQLTSTPASLAYGTVYLGTISTSKSVTIKNTGTASATITAVSSNCKEYKLSAGTTPITLAAGKTTSFSFIFQPDLNQAFNCTYTLTATGTSNLAIPVTGTGATSKAVVSLNTNTLSFPNQTVGTSSAAQNIVISNTGTATIKLNTITVQPATFSIGPVTLPFSIAAKGSLTIPVTYSPQFAISETGTIGLGYNQVAEQVVDVTGNGTAPTSLVITNIPNLPQATQSSAYQVQFIGESGTSPYTFALQTGSTLPSGLTLSSTGLLNGTLASTVAVGNYTFTAQVTDSASHVASKLFTMNVAKVTGSVCNNISYNVPGTSTPMTSLDDLGTGTYGGEEGGLYPSGSNVRPTSQDSFGKGLAMNIQPLDSNGNPSPTGKIGFIGIGESLALDEFGMGFIPIATHDPAINPNITFVDGAQGGATPKLLTSTTSVYWNTILNNYIPDQGLTANQIQVAWIETSDGITTGTFPSDMTTMQGQYESMMGTMYTLFPKLTMVYFSSRIYAGYSNGVAKIDPEPYAYESGFAVKNAINDQLTGKSTLCDGNGCSPVNAPWMSWGPYYWANGLLARSDGWVFTCQDLQKDGTHPTTSGDLKVASQILTFFKTDDTTTTWFLHP